MEQTTRRSTRMRRRVDKRVCVCVCVIYPTRTSSSGFWTADGTFHSPVIRVFLLTRVRERHASLCSPPWNRSSADSIASPEPSKVLRKPQIRTSRRRFPGTASDRQNVGRLPRERPVSTRSLLPRPVLSHMLRGLSVCSHHASSR